ncbi:hypothetical protein B0H17DRAFT_1209108 [Mycena rosella]|uniref:Uncharacterized protein n=1 Tax=Mycena rosella TaxID=1033263 RepID=A0AAD7GA09_MYCRO|nr:hypothetical protein B0H17DRAFT_1209108 [Mycena rosella]
MGHWVTAQKLGSVNNYYPRQSNRNANVADAQENESRQEDSDSDSSPIPNGGSAKSVFTSSSFKSRARPATGDKPRASSSRMNWPEGKTIKGYEFSKHDDVHSDRAPPNGVCYIFSSARHFAQDCPHYGKWLSIRLVSSLPTNGKNVASTLP